MNDSVGRGAFAKSVDLSSIAQTHIVRELMPTNYALMATHTHTHTHTHAHKRTRECAMCACNLSMGRKAMMEVLGFAGQPTWLKIVRFSDKVCLKGII